MKPLGRPKIKGETERLTLRIERTAYRVLEKMSKTQKKSRVQILEELIMSAETPIYKINESPDRINSGQSHTGHISQAQNPGQPSQPSQDQNQPSLTEAQKILEHAVIQNKTSRGQSKSLSDK